MGKHLWLAVVALAFIVREGFILAAWCPDPLRGDAGEYMAYALNLPDYFGRGDAPDAYRSPGYPVLLWLSGSLIYQVQVILGTLTVAATYALGRLWMPRTFALLAALWMALQPHHIAATGTLLSEVLLGALVIGSLLAAAYAHQRRSVALGVTAGVLFACAYLTNPVTAFLPLLLAPFFWRARKVGAAMLLMPLLAIGGWGIRNMDMPGDTRAQLNLVQGSFPEYHQAWKWQRLLMHDKYGEIVAETASGSIRPSLERMAKDPAKYAQWYASKPYLLWDWDIRIGMGGVYSIKFENSPLDRGWLFAVNALQNGLNPLLFALAFCGLVLAYRSPAQAMVAIAVVYVTAVHVVLQAEPRYAIPYRSLEVLLAFSAVAFLRIGEWTRGRVAGAGVRGDALLHAEFVNVAAMPERGGAVGTDDERGGEAKA